MNRKIGVIASDTELKNSIIELFPEDVEQGKIIIDILDLRKFFKNKATLHTGIGFYYFRKLTQK